jgi:hypothetical protein
MKQLVEFPLESGGSVIVQVDEDNPAIGLERAANAGEIVARAGQTLESALSGIRPAIDSIFSRFKDLVDSPDQIELEFGIKLNTQVGLLITSGSSEANMVVRLQWNSSTPKEAK